MKKTDWLHLVVLAAATALAADAPPAAELRAYPLGFADGANAVEIVRAFVGKDGKVVFDPPTRKLLVFTTADRHAQVAQVIKELDVPPQNVRIEVQFKGHSLDTARSAAVEGQGQVVIDSGRVRSSIRLRPRLEDTTGRASSDTSQQLLVASGRQASIFIGEDVPRLEWLMNYGVQYGYLTQRVEWQRVGARLVVEPTVIGKGPTIRIRLTPELSGLVNGNPYRTRFANVATEVAVSDGVPFSLGGLTEHKDFYSQFLIGFDQSGTQQALDITLTARIVPPALR